MSIALNRPSRSTRGKRAAVEDDADEEFWNQAFFAESSEDDSFSEQDEEEDVVDADFFDSEDSSDEEADEDDRRGGDDDDGRKRRKGYVEPKKSQSKKSKKVTPASKKRGGRRAADEEDADAGQDEDVDNDVAEVVEIEDEEDEEQISSARGRKSRKSASASSSSSSFASSASLPADSLSARRPQRQVAAERERERAVRLAMEAGRKKHVIRTKTEYVELTQEQRLAEAVETEKYNAASLKELLSLEEELKKKSFDSKLRLSSLNAQPMVRYFSTSRSSASSPSSSSSKSSSSSSSSSASASRGAILLSFFHPDDPNANVLPAVFQKSLQAAPKPAAQVLCPITQLPARYFDPLTKCPYRDAAAFKQLRQQQQQGSSSASALSGPKVK